MQPIVFLSKRENILLVFQEDKIDINIPNIYRYFNKVCAANLFLVKYRTSLTSGWTPEASVGWWFKESMDITLEELLEAGVHFGHQTRRWDPQMAPFIYGSREGVHIFDLAKTRDALLEAAKAIKDTVSKGGAILLVGTKRQAKDLIQDLAKKTGMPYVTHRWLGGTLTNFEQMRRSVKKLSDLREKRESGGFKGYTKKEKLLIDREIGRLERLFGGLVNLKNIPDMIFVVDTHKEDGVVKEANQLGVPMVAIVDTNANPDLVNYPIPANDDAVKAISLILDFVGKAIEEGKKKFEEQKTATLKK
ncbi:MAG: 30S ribosomal protein S2 [Candidatus Blackburnbacteria bacterium]|nr:30S ribosomal protein S2 [Candidatus Blackburnbacteria bacterium]